MYWHEEIFKVRNAEINTQKVISIPALVQLMQEVSMQHIIKLGASFWDLEAQNLSWVLLRKKITIVDRPSFGQNIKIVTYPAGFDKIFAHRDYKVYDRKNNILAYATSFWSLINTESRRMVKIPEPILDFKYHDESIYLPRIDGKISKISHIDASEVRQVKHYHLDFNEHVNNVKYFYWLLDPIDISWYKNHTIQSVLIHFKGEAVCGDQLKSEVQYLTNKTIHRVVRESDQKIIILAEMDW